jgi:hypothetical protein
MPFTAREFMFERHQHDITQRTPMLSRIAPQALV